MYFKQIDKLGKSRMIQIFGYKEITNGLIYTLATGKKCTILFPIHGETVEIWDGAQCHFHLEGLPMGKQDYYNMYNEKFKHIPKKATYTRKDGVHETKDYKDWYDAEIGGESKK